MSSSKIYITWTTGSSGIGLKLEESLDGGVTFTEIKILPAYYYYWNIIDLTAGTTHTYRLRAYDGQGGYSAYSNPVTVTTSASSFSFTFTKTLYKGVKDQEVTNLQTVLASDPALYPEGLVTGYFGSLTKKAVIKFQLKYGISPIGIVGPKTRGKLNELYGGK